MSPPDPAAYGLRPIHDLAGRPLVAPPAFDALLGYGGDRRHVALAWGAGDTTVYEDGRVSATGHAHPWLYWSRHLAVMPALFGIDVGSSDTPPVHAVVLDRFTSRFLAGRVEDARRFLADAPDLRAEREAWESLSDDEQQAVQERAGEAFREIVADLRDLDSWEEVGNEADRIERALAFDRAAFPRLMEWLDAQPVVCPSCDAEAPAPAFEVARPAACPACVEPFFGQALLARLAEVARQRGL